MPLGVTLHKHSPFSEEVAMRRTLGLTVVVLALAAGCREAARRVFQEPVVALRGVTLRGVGIGGGSLDVALVVHNPNPYALDATRASYRLFAGGTTPGDSVEVGRGTATQPMRVGARDSATLHLPLDVAWDALARAADRAGRDRVVEWHALGEIVAGTPIGEHAFPVDVRGRFTVPRIRVR
jgi:hypothetical protein